MTSHKSQTKKSETSDTLTLYAEVFRNHDRGNTFEVILSALDELGYDVEWQVLNSKDFGVPQNRERVFIIGHFRGQRGRKIFPIGGNGAPIDCEQPKINKVGNIRKKGKSQSCDVVSVDSLALTLCSDFTQKDPLKILLAGNLPGSHEQNGRVYDPKGISPTLNTMQGGGRQPKSVSVKRLNKDTLKQAWGIVLICRTQTLKLAEGELVRESLTH